MKITTLSEQQRRADAGRIVSAPTAGTFRPSQSAGLSARTATLWTGNTWTVAARHEPRPPLTAKAWVSCAIPQKGAAAPDSLGEAEDDAWPHASRR
jgi:hypothetical protein